MTPVHALMHRLLCSWYSYRFVLQAFVAPTSLLCCAKQFHVAPKNLYLFYVFNIARLSYEFPLFKYMKKFESLSFT